MGAAGGGWFLLAGDQNNKPDTDSAPGTYEVVAVRKQTLTVGATLTGKIGYGTPSSLPIRASGTVTWLPTSGSVVTRGGALLRVDNKPVVLMYGSTPSYRALYDTTADQSDDNSSDEDDATTSSRTRSKGSNGHQQATPTPSPLSGPDVEQLEANLVALGYGGFDVDEEFTPYTAAAVKEWQNDLGIPATGRVDLGDVLFSPGPVRVVTDSTALGTDAASTAVHQTSTHKIVTAKAPADSLGWAEKGAKVKATLPNQRSMRATVSSVGTSTDSAGDVSVKLSLAHPSRAPQSGAVTISYVAQQRRNVLTVPVTALVALAEGGYGVQLDGSGEGTFVAVTPGLYADGRVEIGGDIRAGTKIRVPR